MRLKDVIKTDAKLFRHDMYHALPLKFTLLPEVTESFRCLPCNYMTR